MPTIAPPKYHGLRMHDPRIVTKYIDILEKHISYHRLEPKISSLYHMAKNNDWTTLCTEAYKKIDRLLTEGMLHAEGEVSRKFSRTFVWSPTLSCAVKTIHYW